MGLCAVACHGMIDGMHDGWNRTGRWMAQGGVTDGMGWYGMTHTCYKLHHSPLDSKKSSNYLTPQIHCQETSSSVWTTDTPRSHIISLNANGTCWPFLTRQALAQAPYEQTCTCMTLEACTIRPCMWAGVVQLDWSTLSVHLELYENRPIRCALQRRLLHQLTALATCMP